MSDLGGGGDLAVRESERGGAGDRLLVFLLGVALATRGALDRALTTTYTASLHTLAASDPSPAPTPPLLCHLAAVPADASRTQLRQPLSTA